jgi:hypothetical protein
MRSSLVVLLLAGLPAVALAQAPRTLTVRSDTGSANAVQHAPMPPGWHVTTGPGAILFDPALVTRGRFAVGLDAHLFPGTSQEGFGVFLGGSNLDANPGYLAFLIRRDGSASIEIVEGTQRTALVPWMRAPSVKPHPGGDDTAFNTMLVRADVDSVRFEVNGQRVAAIARAGYTVDGAFGIRAGRDLNLHVTNLDITTRLAPAPAPKRAAPGS